MLDKVTRLIYGAVEEGITTTFLLWHQGKRGRGT